jgi:hypothetical protein
VISFATLTNLGFIFIKRVHVPCPSRRVPVSLCLPRSPANIFNRS